MGGGVFVTHDPTYLGLTVPAWKIPQGLEVELGRGAGAQ